MADCLTLPVMGRKHGVHSHDRYIEKLAQLLREGRGSHLMQSCALRPSDEPAMARSSSRQAAMEEQARADTDVVRSASEVGSRKKLRRWRIYRVALPSAKKTLVSRIGGPGTSGHMRYDVVRDCAMTRSSSFRANMASHITLSRDKDAG